MRKVLFIGKKELSANSVVSFESLASFRSLVRPAALMLYVFIYTACPTPNAERHILQLADEHSEP